MESTADTLEGRLGGSTSIKEREDTDPDTLQKGPKRRGTCCCSSPPPTADYCLTRLMALALAAVALLPSPASSLIPEFLSYKTCVNQPPAFSGCMSNVTADFGERVVLNCQVGRTEKTRSIPTVRCVFGNSDSDTVDAKLNK